MKIIRTSDEFIFAINYNGERESLNLLNTIENSFP